MMVKVFNSTTSMSRMLSLKLQLFDRRFPFLLLLRKLIHLHQVNHFPKSSPASRRSFVVTPTTVDIEATQQLRITALLDCWEISLTAETYRDILKGAIMTVFPLFGDSLANWTEFSADRAGGVTNAPVIESRCAVDPLECRSGLGSRGIHYWERNLD